MRYETIEQLKDSDFKRLTGVECRTFEQMLTVIEKGLRDFGRPPKLSRADQLLLTLMYWREYRTEFHIAQSYGVSEEIVLRQQLSGLEKYFGNALFSGLDVPAPKPAPDVYLSAARSFGIPPSQCIVVEDSIPGVTAGVRAGMRVYGHAAFTPTEKLADAGAIPFMNMSELKNILTHKPQG